MRYEELFQWVQLGASLAAVVGIAFAAYQLLETKRQAATSFEDQIAREYRDIARSLPLWVLLDEEVLPEEYKKALHTFHQYFELSNYQVFLRRRKRIRDETWAEWREGILHTMRRPAFRRAWEDIKPGSCTSGLVGA